MSKVHGRSLNLSGCVIPVPELKKCVIPALKLGLSLIFIQMDQDPRVRSISHFSPAVRRSCCSTRRHGRIVRQLDLEGAMLADMMRKQITMHARAPHANAQSNTLLAILKTAGPRGTGQAQA